MADSGVIVSLDSDAYIAAFSREKEALARAAAGKLDAPVPSCPGWSMATLVAHLGGTYASIAKTISVGTGEDIVQELEDLGLPEDIEQWFREDSSLEHMPPTVLDWFCRTGENLEEIFRDTDTSAPAWTWWEPDQSAGFWLRRMANETAVHRWDAESALGRPDPIEPVLARDGIDEMVDIYIPRWCRPKSALAGSGQSFRFVRTDGDGSWTVRFEGEGMSTDDEPAADVILRSPASDLLLFLWQRILPDRLDVEGDVALLGRYFEFVPPD